MSKTIQEALHILIDAFQAQDIKPPIEMVLERGELMRLQYYADAKHSWLGADSEGRFKMLHLYGITFSEAKS